MAQNNHLLTEQPKKSKFVRMREKRHNPRLLHEQIKAIKETNTFPLNSDGKESTLRKKKMCRLATQSEDIILRHFTEVKGINIGELVTETHFNTLEVCMLFEIFSCLSKRNSKPKMTQLLENSVVRQFLVDNFEITDENSLYCVVNTISNGKTTTSPKDFVKGFSVILRGSLKEKAQFVFKTFDKDQNGFLTKMVELNPLFDNNTSISYTNVVSTNPGTDRKQPYRDTIEFLLRKFDPSKKGEVSFENFFETIKEEPLLMECCFSVFPSQEMINTFQTIFLMEQK